MIDPRPRMMPILGWPALISALILTAVGLIGIYAGEAGTDALPTKTIKQLLHLCIGMFGFLLIQIL